MQPDMATTLLFVDADNQTPILASTLTRFLKTIGRGSTKAIIAGNGVGDRVKNWESALKNACPDIEVLSHVAPLRKQSADVRLMFELAPFYHGQSDPSVLLVIFSRDDLLVAAAECLMQKGLNVMIALGATSNGTTLTTEVPVVLLATPQTAVPQGEASPPNTPAVLSERRIDQTVAKQDAAVVVAAVTKIRQQLKPNKHGGYAASAVGQVLAQLGHDKANRTKIVKQIPNLKEVGTGPEKRLIF